MKPIYKPSGKALEYGDCCINIYTGCNHGCTYCFAPSVLHKTREQFEDVQPREGLINALGKQLAGGVYIDKLIHLCFTCDPYPADIDTSITRDVIYRLKMAGSHVQILTKGGLRAERDIDLLDGRDWFGVTYTGYGTGELYIPVEAEPNAAPASERLASLARAREMGIKTWMSCEPVLNEQDIYTIIECAGYVDMFRIGKLNYHPSDINWREFGLNCERLCKANRRNYMIKDGLRKEMEG